MRRARGALIAMILLGATVAVTAQPASANASPAGGQGPAAVRAQISTPPITRAEVLARADSWVGKGIVYDQNGYYGGYRTDCSGYVSMAWDLGASLTTDTFASDGVITSITKSQLQPGDALLNPAPGNDGHVVLFDHWDSADQSSYVGYELDGSNNVEHHSIPYPYFAGAGTFNPVRYVNIVDGRSSQVVATEPGTGTVFHELRNADGSWTGWAPVAGYQGSATFDAAQVAIAGMPDGTAQVIATQPSTGTVFHEIRNTNGSWTGWAPLAGYHGSATFNAAQIAIAGMPDGSAQVVATQPGSGTVFHEIRRADGSWTGWAPLAGYQGSATFNAAQVSIAGLPDGTAQVVATQPSTGTVFHEVRRADGSWTGWAPLAGYHGSATFNAAQVSITGLPDGTAQIVATQPSTGTVFHEIRRADGSWTGWAPPAGYQGSATFDAAQVSIAGMPDGTAQLIATQPSTGTVFHEIRNTNGSWTGWAPLAGYHGSATFNAADAAIG